MHTSVIRYALLQRSTIFFSFSGPPHPWQWRRCSWTPPPPRWSQTLFYARVHGSTCFDIALRLDTTRFDSLDAAAASFFDLMALQHHLHHHCGNFNPGMPAAARLTITLRAFPPGFTPRLTPARPNCSRHATCKSMHSPVYGQNVDVTDSCQRLHVPCPSISALPCRYRTRPFHADAEIPPSPPLPCMLVSRTHTPTHQLCCTCAQLSCTC